MADELLYEDELQALTLRAPFVHEHADRPYFLKEINNVAAQLNEQPFLNYFVRYRVDKADPSQHRWSRIRRVIFVSERDKYSEPQASAPQPDTAAPPDASHDAGEDTARGSHTHSPSATGLSIAVPAASAAHSHYFTWRNKTFWVALVVEGESSPVYLPRLSSKLPTAEEVMAFCVHQANHNPQERYADQPADFADADHAAHDEPYAAEAEQPYEEQQQYAQEYEEQQQQEQPHEEEGGGGVAETAAETNEGDAEGMQHDEYNNNNNHYEYHYENNNNNNNEEYNNDNYNGDYNGYNYDGNEGDNNNDNNYGSYAYEDATTSDSPRSYLPTSQQIAKLREYRQQHLVQHQWTSEEVQEAKELNARYSRAGVAATPVRATHVHLHNMQLETEIGLAAGGTAGLPPRRLPRLPASPQLSQSLFMPAASLSASQADAREQTAPPSDASQSSPGVARSGSETTGSAFTASSPIATPLSPFLPRRLQRQLAAAMQQQQGASMSGSLHDTAQRGEEEDGAPPSSSFASPSGPSQGTVSAFLAAAAAGEARAVSSPAPPHSPGVNETATPAVIDERVTQQWAEAAEQEQAFYQYVSNAQRSEYLNKLAAITRRNSEENKRNRLRGIENERRLKRQGNLLESGGLWVTDDRERARKAALYKASLEGTDSASTARTQNAPRKEEAAQAAQTHNAEEAFLRHFREMHSAQTLNFSAVPDDLLDEFGGVDTAKSASPAPQKSSSTASASATATAAAAPLSAMPLEADELENVAHDENEEEEDERPAEEGEMGGSVRGLDPATAALLSRTPYRLVRGAPGADSAMLLQSQLLHVSAAHMARRRLRGRTDEDEGGSHSSSGGGGTAAERTTSATSERPASFAASAEGSTSDAKRRRVES